MGGNERRSIDGFDRAVAGPDDGGSEHLIFRSGLGGDDGGGDFQRGADLLAESGVEVFHGGGRVCGGETGGAAEHGQQPEHAERGRDKDAQDRAGTGWQRSQDIPGGDCQAGEDGGS